MSEEFKKEKFVLNKPLLGWEIDEELYFDTEWGSWTVRGEEFTTRSTIGVGEVVMLLNFLRANQVTTILVQVKENE